jgi:hypothetical protein
MKDSIFVIVLPIRIRVGTIYERDSVQIVKKTELDTVERKDCPCQQDSLFAWGIYGVRFYAFKDSLVWQSKIQLQAE